MVDLVNKINAIAKLGEILRNPDQDRFHGFRAEISKLRDLVVNSNRQNPWFTPEQVQRAIQATGESLKRIKLEKWVENYERRKLECSKRKTVAAVMAGNIPMVGFQDYLAVMMTNHHLLAKVSSDDKDLLPLMHRILTRIEPSFKDRAVFTEDTILGFDAVIATGSNNTARYFAYYFGKYPHIIRKNRNGVAILTGNETSKQLAALGADIFSYYGLGCRNLSKLYVPEDYDFSQLFENLEEQKAVINHHKYANNYDYNKSIFLVNKVPHLDNGFLLFKEDQAISSPVSVVHFEHYSDIENVNQIIDQYSNLIQCVVSADKRIAGSIPPGTTQAPELWDYADGIDTIKFLIELK